MDLEVSQRLGNYLGRLSVNLLGEMPSYDVCGKESMDAKDSDHTDHSSISLLRALAQGKDISEKRL